MMPISRSYTPNYTTDMFESFGRRVPKLEALAMDLGLGMVAIVSLSILKKHRNILTTKYLITEIDEISVRISLGMTMEAARERLKSLEPYFGPCLEQEPDEIVEEVYIIRDLFDPDLDYDEQQSADAAIDDIMLHAQLISWTEPFEVREH